MSDAADPSPAPGSEPGADPGAQADGPPARIVDLIDDLISEDGEGGERISVDDILERLEHRSFGPILLVPALIAVLPVVGALPGVSAATALIVLFASLQFALSRPKLWLPGPLRRADFDRDRFEAGLKAARPRLAWLDRVLHPRLQLALARPMPRIIAWTCTALGALMTVYALVPGGVVIPAAAVILLALGLTTHDGLFVYAGFAAAALALAGSAWIVTGLL